MTVNEAVFTWGWRVEIAAVFVGVVFLVLIIATIVLARFIAKLKLEDRSGQVIFGALATIGFFLLWDYFDISDGAGSIVTYTIGSFMILVGFQLARGFCWSLVSKQVPTNSKGLGNMLLFMMYITGRGAGALIADCYRTDAQTNPTWYQGQGFTWTWTPRNTYAWTMQLLCLAVTLTWLLSYKMMIPCKGSS